MEGSRRHGDVEEETVFRQVVVRVVEVLLYFFGGFAALLGGFGAGLPGLRARGGGRREDGTGFGAEAGC